MKRDWDLVRRIVLTTWNANPDQELDHEAFPDVDAEVFAEHVRLLKEKGLVEGTVERESGVGHYASIERLTWDGQDFAKACQDDTIWKRARTLFTNAATVVTLEVLKAWLNQQAQNSFGSAP